MGLHECLQCFDTVGWATGRASGLHMVQWILLLLTVSCFSKIQIGFTFLVLAHLGSPGQRAVKRVCVCVHGASRQKDKKNRMERTSGTEGNESLRMLSDSVGMLAADWQT